MANPIARHLRQGAGGSRNRDSCPGVIRTLPLGKAGPIEGDLTRGLPRNLQERATAGVSREDIAIWRLFLASGRAAPIVNRAALMRCRRRHEVAERPMSRSVSPRSSEATKPQPTPRRGTYAMGLRNKKKQNSIREFCGPFGRRARLKFANPPGRAGQLL